VGLPKKERNPRLRGGDCEGTCAAGSCRAMQKKKKGGNTGRPRRFGSRRAVESKKKREKEEGKEER